MQYTMKLLQKPFENIKNGTKTVEFRLYDDKRRNIKIGDTITFYLLPELKESITTEVIDLYRADTFYNLFKQIFENESEIQEKLKGIHEIYSENKEQEYGVLGIKIKLLD